MNDVAFCSELTELCQLKRRATSARLWVMGVMVSLSSGEPVEW